MNDKIRLYDDKKGKWQSFEASIKINDNTTLEGFGYNEEDAVSELRGVVNLHIVDLEKELESLKLFNFDSRRWVKRYDEE